MYKCRLQEICHQRRWALPTYSAMKDGPDHLPSFKSSVSVNGLSFDSTESWRTLREAHNDAAKEALLHFAPALPQSVAELNAEGPKVGEISLGPETLCGTFTAVDDMHYKNQLLIYAQLENLDIPRYSSQIEGTSHDPRFKATVAIGGCTFESPEQFRTLKEAEQAAAKSAFMSLSQDGFQVGDYGLYKNLLQEFAQREKIHMPAYKTEKSGPPHNPAFFSSVEVGGEVFHGKPGGSKKEAEREAAKVAYSVLKERKSGSPSTSVIGGIVGDENLKTTADLDPTLSAELKRKLKQKSAIKYEGNGVPENATPFSAKTEVEKSKSIPISPNGVPGISTLAISGSNVNKTKETKPYLLNNRVRVYPYFPDTAFPEGITVLPIGEDKWVAVSLEFPNEDAA
ncbi:double-stranded RNA-binding protein 1-like [Tripterygium wilfordii]|nr:double-stranded RNA-binding protein 1-like [Tripterygium wilfordii]